MHSSSPTPTEDDAADGDGDGDDVSVSTDKAGASDRILSGWFVKKVPNRKDRRR